MRATVKKLKTQLRVIRKLRGFSMEIAAHHTGVSVSSWSRWESGRGQPSRMALQAIAQKFGPELEKLRPLWYTKLKEEYAAQPTSP